MPNHKKQIDPEQVRKLAAIGCTHEEIASIVKCSVDTLTRRFLDDIEEGRNQGKSSLRRKQWEMAINGNVTMLVWLGKQYLGQTDKQAITDVTEEYEIFIGEAKEADYHRLPAAESVAILEEPKTT